MGVIKSGFEVGRGTGLVQNIIW